MFAALEGKSPIYSPPLSYYQQVMRVEMKLFRFYSPVSHKMFIVSGTSARYSNREIPENFTESKL